MRIATPILRVALLAAPIICLLALTLTTRAADPKKPPEAIKTGLLKDGIAAIGGETTGWILVGDDKKSIDVDISAVKDDAKAAAGKRVTITGTIIQKEWVERGKQPLLVAKKIEVVKAKE